MSNDHTSESLLERLRLGPSDESWYEFVTLYNGLIEGWLRRHGVSSSDAEDIRQDVMAVVLREIESFEHNGRVGAFRNWLRTTTSHRLRQFWRSHNRHQNAEQVNLENLAAQLEDETSDLSRAWNRQHDQIVLGKLLTRISRQFKPESLSAFRQVVIEQRPIEEVSKDLNLSINAIRIAQSRITRELRKSGKGLIDN